MTAPAGTWTGWPVPAPPNRTGRAWIPATPPDWIAGVTQPTPELHVRPHSRTGQWLVTVADDATLSCHDTADAAARRARNEASARRLPCIYVHDRYHRVRAVSLRGSG